MSIVKQIGSITIVESYVYHKADYETASAWTDFNVLPGTYAVMAAWSSIEMFNCAAPRPSQVWFKATAEITASHYENRLFHATSIKTDEDKGQVVEQSCPIRWSDERITLTEEAQAKLAQYQAWLATNQAA
jgi:hypothetical protein